jgi:hypothetical protein
MEETGWVTRDYIFHDRVRQHTTADVNERIDLLTQAFIYKARGEGADILQRRLQALDREWDIDRAVMLLFSLAGGASFLAGLAGRRRWLGFFTAQLAFLGIHATLGWCPPVPILRRLGFRTSHEIEAEKHALLLLMKDENDVLAEAA